MRALLATPAKPLLDYRLLAAVGAVTALALLLRYEFVIHAQVDNPFRGDAFQYHAYAWNMVHHHVFSMAKPGSLPVPDNFREPGYPLLLSAWMLITDDLDMWYAGVLLTQAVLGALTATLTLLLARLWLPLGWSVACGTLAAIWPHNVAMTEYLLSETLFGFLFVLAVFAFGRLLKLKSTTSAIAAGIALGMSALVNPVVLPLALILPIGSMLMRALPRRLALAFVLSAAILPVAWNVRSAYAVDGGASSRQRALITLDVGSWPGYFSAWRASLGVEPSGARETPVTQRAEQIEAGRKALEPMNREQALLLADPRQGLEAMLSRFAEAPGHYAAWYLVQKPALLWGWDICIGQGDIYVHPTRGSLFEVLPLSAVAAACHGVNPILGLLALGAVVMIIFGGRRGFVLLMGSDRDSDGAILSCLALLVVFLTLLHTVLQAEPRYSIPYRPFEFALGVTMLAALIRHVRNRSAQRNVGPNGAGEAQVSDDML